MYRIGQKIFPLGSSLWKRKLSCSWSLRKYCSKRTPSKSPYQVLGITEDATPEEIKSTYYILSKKYHPDSHFSTNVDDCVSVQFLEVQNAYKLLSNPFSKMKYDHASKLMFDDHNIWRQYKQRMDNLNTSFHTDVCSSSTSSSPNSSPESETKRNYFQKKLDNFTVVEGVLVTVFGFAVIIMILAKLYLVDDVRRVEAQKNDLPIQEHKVNLHIAEYTTADIPNRKTK